MPFPCSDSQMIDNRTIHLASKTIDDALTVRNNGDMLSRDQAIGLLAEHGRGAGWTKHCFAVADLALKIGSLLENRLSIDRRFLWSAALLHDIGRCVTHDPILHGVEGYKLLTSLGHQQEAAVCASHILFGLKASEAVQFGLPARDFLPHKIEERLVPLADFMIEYDQPTTLDNRFASLRKRNAGNDFFLDKLDRAQNAAESLMTQLNREIGVPIEEALMLNG